MPTVFRFDGFRVVIYPNDHEPSHVHVMRAEYEAIFYLNCVGGPVTLRANLGFPERVLNVIIEELSARVEELCLRWEDIHADRE